MCTSGRASCTARLCALRCPIARYQLRHTAASVSDGPSVRAACSTPRSLHVAAGGGACRQTAPSNRATYCGWETPEHAPRETFGLSATCPSDRPQSAASAYENRPADIGHCQTKASWRVDMQRYVHCTRTTSHGQMIAIIRCRL